MHCILLLVLSAGWSAAPQAGPSAGTTLPVSRDLAVRFADAEAFLAAGRIEAGVTILQELGEADPGVLLSTADADLFLGAAAQAGKRLASLPPDWQAQREKIFGARAAEELRAALDPPDLTRLEQLARQYAGMNAGAQAQLAAAELWLDRGQAALARQLDPQHLLPPISDAGQPPPEPEPEAAQRLPALQDLADPRLPYLDSTELQPLWSRNFEDRSRNGMQVMHRLAIGGGVVYACDGYEVLALEAGSGRELWRYEADPRWGTTEGSDRLRDAVSQHALTAPVLAEGVLLAVVHEAQPLGRLDSYMRIPIRRLMPARRLVALDARDGRLLWKMSTSWSAGKDDPRELAAGPPAVSAGRVYLPVYDAVGTIDFSLMALDLRTGRILWRRFLVSGQLETNLFGNVLVELATPPPLADPERVFVCSHLGSFHALDAATGATLWARAYPRLEVQPTETGRLATRPQQLSRNLGASDGQRVLWAPVDGDSIYLLGAEDGKRLAAWPAVDQLNRHLFTLLGLQADGVWAAGSRVALLRTSGAQPALYSEPLYEEGGQLLATRSGALVRGEILLPLLYESVERFTSGRLARGGRVLDFNGERLASGSLQAAPGLLFIERPGGFDAFGSLRSIADSFQSAQLDLATLTELLPVALNLDFSAVPDNARRLAAAAAALAARPEFARQHSTLRLLAARSWLQAGEPDRAEILLLQLLDGPESALAEAACGLLLDDPYLLEPLRAGVERAIAAAAGWPDRLLPLHDGSTASSRTVAARARALRALAGDRRLPVRRSLTDLLLLPTPGGLSVDGQPVQEWAEAALRLLLRDPAELAAYEQDGRDRMTQSGCSAEALRAFGPTAAAQETLAREVQRLDLPRAERLLRARWRREYGAPDRDWPDVARWFPPAPALPPAPRSLPAGGAIRARYGSPLLVRANEEGTALAWVPAKSGAQLFSFAAVAFEQQAYPIPGRGLTGMETLVPISEGCAVILRDRILHLLEKGGVTEVPLPAELADNAQSLALGDGLVAIVLRAQPGFLRIAVLDASTGASYLEEDLPGQPGPRIELRSAGRWLYVFEENAALAYRIDLHFKTPPASIALATPMNGVDMPTATLADGAVHYMLNRNRPPMGWVVCAGPGSAPLQFPFEGQYVRRVRAGPGLAWVLQPPARAASADARFLYWLAPGAREPQRIPLSNPEARLLQLVESEYKRNTEPVPSEALALVPEADGSTRVEAYRSGAGGPVWTCALTDLDFRDLVANQPSPRQAADAWILPLLLRPTAIAAARLELFVIEADGRLRARATADWAGGSVEQVRVDLLPAAILVRNGDTLTLYGEAR